MRWCSRQDSFVAVKREAGGELGSSNPQQTSLRCPRNGECFSDSIARIAPVLKPLRLYKRGKAATAQASARIPANNVVLVFKTFVLKLALFAQALSGTTARALCSLYLL
jgi:hypothetical protein